ncbi:MAG: hypothetical protein AABW90_00445 [Nanoarchaeota archaeon]
MLFIGEVSEPETGENLLQKIFSAKKAELSLVSGQFRRNCPLPKGSGLHEISA